MQVALSLTKLIRGLGKAGVDAARPAGYSGSHRIIGPIGLRGAKVASDTAGSKIQP